MKRDRAQFLMKPSLLGLVFVVAGSDKDKRCDEMRCDARRLFRDGPGPDPDQGHAHANCKNEKLEKRAITKSTITPTHIAFIHSELDTVASLARRIFLWEGVVQGRSTTRHLQVNVKTK